MTNAFRCLLLAGLPLIAIQPAFAKDKEEETKRAVPVQQLYDCRAIADADQRLACFDRTVAALEVAEAKREVTIADKETVKKTRRGLFGFSLPRIGLFGGDDDAEEIKEIEAVVKSASIDRSGKYRIVMEDGAVWQQIDTTRLPREPKPGQKVKIRVAAMGSYFANVDGQRAIRMKRDR
jgi:hypothetical protein